MAKYIMAIDQGTTSTRACLVTPDGRLAAQVSEPFEQIYPKPGWVEHDPETIWGTVGRTVKAVLEKVGARGADVAAIGITNQRETVVVWDAKTGRPISNAIVWQCRRTHEACEKLRKAGQARGIRAKTGLVLDPYFSATKIQWILKNVKGAAARAKAGELRAGTIDSFLLDKLTGVHKTDVSNGSRTMLMNIGRVAWDDDLLKLFGVPASLLPEIAPSSGEFGRTRGLDFLPDGIPVTGIAGDQQAALFGQAAFREGEAKCTFGTGSFLLLNTGSKRRSSRAKLLTTIAWQIGSQKPVYALEGGAFVCGAAVQWLRDGLGLISKSAEVEALASTVSDAAGVEFVPALTGLGAPHWRADARGVITGLTRGTTKAHIARATLEAMALQNADILAAMEKDLGRRLKTVRVDGGASANNLLMQMQADVQGTPVVRPMNVETTAMGAAYLAGLGVGLWTSLEEIEKIWARDREFKPMWTPAQRRERQSGWLRAVGKTT